MCLNTTRQEQTKMIGVITIIVSIMLIVFIQFSLLHCLSNDRLKNRQKNDSATQETNCYIRLDKKHEMSYRSILFSVMIFLVGIDIPSGMLLIWGAMLKLKTNVFPWLCVNIVKMMIIVVFFVVWSIHAMGGFTNANLLDITESHQHKKFGHEQDTKEGLQKNGYICYNKTVLFVRFF